MFNGRYFLVSFLFVAFLSGSALQAGEILWTGAGDDDMYCTPENWDGNCVPDVNYDGWVTGELDWGDLNDAFIDDPYLASPVIIDANCIPPRCGKLVVGGDKVVPGIGLEIKGGLFRPFELLVGYRPGSSGTIRMTGGVINMWDYSYLGVGDGGDGTFIMDGGEINLHLSETCKGDWIDWAGGLLVPKGEKGPASGHLQINGGIIRCKWFEIREGGTVDIAGGTLAITMPDYWYWDADQRLVMDEYISTGVLTAYKIEDEERTIVVGVDDDKTGYYLLTGYKYDFGQAYNPSPRCGASNVPLEPQMSWSPGDYADTHEVYFGEDKLAVEEAIVGSPEHWDTYAYEVNSFDPGVLKYGKTYYWRVDEVNTAEVNSPWKGMVWRFRTPSHLEVDNFDSYDETDELRVVWNDYWTNQTGSTTTLETEIGHDGNSLKFTYCNLGYWAGCGDDYYSEIEAAVGNLVIGPDWDYGGIKSLGLWFFGDEENDANEQMYMVLEDSVGRDAELPYNGDMNDIRIEEWQQWNIALDDFNEVEPALDRTNISKIYIGFGIRGNEDTPGGDGKVWFDEFRLYPRRCIWDISHGHGDATGDCLVDSDDLSIMAADWLVYDYNTVGLAATLMNYDDPDSAWRPGEGKIGGALHFAGGDPNHPTSLFENVAIPPLNLWEPDADGVTISAWIKPQGDQYEASGIVFCRDGPEGAYLEGDTCGGLGINKNNVIMYHWHDSYWNFPTGATAPDETWCFVALVVTPDKGTIWFEDGTGLSYRDNEAPHEVEAFADITRIGEDEHGQPRNFKGLIDDVRIYTYALDETQIGQLAGLSGEPSPGPLVHYELDEELGTTASDSSGSVFYYPILSPANAYDEEAQYHKSVNLLDYCALADNWLEEVWFP